MRPQATGPPRRGRKIFEIRVPVQEGEVNVENNVVERTVLRPQDEADQDPLRRGRAALGVPLRQDAAGAREPARGGEQELRPEGAAAGRRPAVARAGQKRHRRVPATKQELQQFDVVILGDFDPRTAGPKMNGEPAKHGRLREGARRRAADDRRRALRAARLQGDAAAGRAAHRPDRRPPAGRAAGRLHGIVPAGADPGGPDAPDLQLQQPRREGERRDLEWPERAVLVVGGVRAEACRRGAG